jgi:hypothetical protein
VNTFQTGHLSADRAHLMPVQMRTPGPFHERAEVRAMDKQERREAYMRKLRDPRWQKKRLEVLSRDDWACQMCDDTESTLNVHHRYYTQGAEPWEYPMSALVTLCESCHQIETEAMPEVCADLLLSMKKLGATSSTIAWIAGILHEATLREVHLDDYDWSVLAYGLFDVMTDIPGGRVWLALNRKAQGYWKKVAEEKREGKPA